MNLSEKTKTDLDLKALLIQGWMVVMALFMIFRFWMVKAETVWLLMLDTYQGEETASIVKVSLGRDGLVSLLMAVWLLFVYGSMVVRYRKTRAGSEPERKTDGQQSTAPNPAGPVR